MPASLPHMLRAAVLASADLDLLRAFSGHLARLAAPNAQARAVRVPWPATDPCVAACCRILRGYSSAAGSRSFLPPLPPRRILDRPAPQPGSRVFLRVRPPFLRPPAPGGSCAGRAGRPPAASWTKTPSCAGCPRRFQRRMGRPASSAPARGFLSACTLFRLSLPAGFRIPARGILHCRSIRGSEAAAPGVRAAAPRTGGAPVSVERVCGVRDRIRREPAPRTRSLCRGSQRSSLCARPPTTTMFRS